jgi:hypothetical protein
MGCTAICVQAAVHRVALAVITLSTGELALVEAWVRRILLGSTNVDTVGILRGGVAGAAAVAITAAGVAVAISIPAAPATAATTPTTAPAVPIATPSAITVPITATLATAAFEALRGRTG